MVTDYLFSEPLIIKRLRETLPDLREITGAAGLAQIQEENIPAPAAYVLYLGDSISATPAATGGIQARQQFVTQLWAVVVVVYYADGRGMGEEINSEAGPYLSRVIEALSGWKPEIGSCPPVRRHPQQLPAQYEDGYGFFPLVFQVQIPASLGGYK
ncbi:phage tail terminator protein [Leminorella grimontii]|uniref:phage tail terminator protein n=1 Tax=Leminorella grimontii TaxID=82981 RepID=UPI0032209249